MFSTWDLVRPSLWHPMSMVEQSMMDLDMMANQMLGSRFPMTQSMLTAPSTREDDDFFKDLPVTAREKEPAATQPQAQREGTRAFSSYSFSNSSVVDDKGRRIESTRRRYEDSTGRLKAVHERAVGDKSMKTVWNRKSRDDEGEHRTLCSKGSPEEFEKVWSSTPFGQAQETKTKEIESAEHSGGGKQGHKAVEQQQQQSASRTGQHGHIGSVCSNCDTTKPCTPGCPCTRCTAAKKAEAECQKQCASDCNCSDCEAKKRCPPNCDCSACQSAQQSERKTAGELKSVPK